MKNFRKIALPVAILLMGAGSAYATTAFKSSNVVDQPGYRYDPSAPVGQRCILTEKMCTDIEGDVCTYSDPSSGTQNLSKFLNGTSCGDQLFEIQ